MEKRIDSLNNLNYCIMSEKAGRIGVLDIKTIHDGPSAYADSEYEWELTTKEDIDEAELYAFCQMMLRKNTQSYEDWLKKHNNSAKAYFRGYYSLVKKSSDTWIYRVVEPYCD